MSGFGLLFAGPIQGHYWFRYLDKVGWSCNHGLSWGRTIMLFMSMPCNVPIPLLHPKGCSVRYINMQRML